MAQIPSAMWSRPVHTDVCSMFARMSRYAPAACGIRSPLRDTGNRTERQVAVFTGIACHQLGEKNRTDQRTLNPLVRNSSLMALPPMPYFLITSSLASSAATFRTDAPDRAPGLGHPWQEMHAPLSRERQATHGPSQTLSVARPCPRPLSVAVRGKPTVTPTVLRARTMSAMRPWTPQFDGLQRDKVTHGGTKKKRPAQPRIRS
jgi:hypothetical protein